MALYMFVTLSRSYVSVERTDRCESSATCSCYSTREEELDSHVALVMTRMFIVRTIGMLVFVPLIRIAAFMLMFRPQNSDLRKCGRWRRWLGFALHTGMNITLTGPFQVNGLNMTG